MDELFLQILRANEQAQTSIAHTQNASNDNVNQLAVLKQNIDTSELEKFELESLKIKESTQQKINTVKSEAQATLAAKKQELHDDFKAISESRRAAIIKEVCDVYGE